MATRQSAAKSAARRATTQGKGPAAGTPASLFNYYSELAAANAEMLEQGMRLMGAPLQRDPEAVNGMLDGFSLSLKLMEQYQEMALAQFEAMSEFQSQLWQGLWPAAGEPSATRQTEAERH